MPTQPVTEAKLAWLIWQALEKLNARLWDRYEKDFHLFAREDQNSTDDADTPSDF